MKGKWDAGRQALCVPRLHSPSINTFNIETVRKVQRSNGAVQKRPTFLKREEN
jgi:hypothetical protein